MLFSAATDKSLEEAQKALSAVLRTGQRFGVSHLVDVLRGANTDKIRQFEHDQLPTHGVGLDLDNNQWRSVFRQLVARGYLSVDLDRSVGDDSSLVLGFELQQTEAAGGIDCWPSRNDVSVVQILALRP